MQITFDTNLAGVWNTRVFWATLCEELGQTMKLTPTATVEVLRRIRLETEREWTKKLKALNQDQAIGWSKVEVRRLATTAATATRDRFQAEMTKQGAIYEGSRPTRGRAEAAEADIEELIDDRAFDLSTDNGIRDRKIVIEAMARGYDILASNNVESIDHGMLRDWLKRQGGPVLGLSTTILRPEPAEERLRNKYEKLIEWTAYAAARACVTDPYDKTRAGQEMTELLEGFEERGMSELKQRIHRLISKKREFDLVLMAVAKHGPKPLDARGAGTERSRRRSGVEAGREEPVGREQPDSTVPHATRSMSKAVTTPIALSASTTSAGVLTSTTFRDRQMVVTGSSPTGVVTRASLNFASIPCVRIASSSHLSVSHRHPPAERTVSAECP